MEDRSSTENRRRGGRRTKDDDAQSEGEKAG